MRNKLLIAGAVIIILLVIGASVYAFAGNNDGSNQDSSMDSPEVNKGNGEVMDKEGDKMMEDSPEANKDDDKMDSDDAMMEDKEDGSMEKMESEDSMMKEEDAAGVYTNYSDANLATASAGRIVIFFHANWCPSCREHSQNIEAAKDQIPSDVTILKADYDSSIALRQKYGVTTQHSFVQVDSNGNEIQKWNALYSGDDLQDILDRI